jgi:hypothetical protein
MHNYESPIKAASPYPHRLPLPEGICGVRYDVKYPVFDLDEIGYSSGAIVITTCTVEANDGARFIGVVENRDDGSYNAFADKQRAYGRAISRFSLRT